MAFDPNDPADKKILADAVKEAVEEAKAGLEAKNKELLDEAKAAKAELRKHKDIDPADVAKLEADADQLRADLAAANKVAKEAATAAEKATKALEAETGVTRDLLAKNGLTQLLIKGGVKDEDFLDMAISKFLPQVQIVSDGDRRVAKIGDKDIEAHVAEYLASDAGKKIVAAPNNSGGGSGGSSGGGGSGKTISLEKFNELDPKGRAAHFAEGGIIEDAA